MDVNDPVQRRELRTTLLWLGLLTLAFAAAWIWNGAAKHSAPVNQIVSFGFALCLLILSAIDLDRFLLPDALTLPLIVSGVVWTGFVQQNLFLSTLGAAIGYACLAGLAWAWRRWRGEWGLGLGDAKLLAALGAWLTALQLPFLLLLASGLGLFIAVSVRIATQAKDSQKILPFGPFLCASGWALWCAPNISV